MTEEKKNRVNVKIYYEEYAMCGTATPDYLKRLAQYVDDKMQQIGEANKRLGTSKVAVLTAVNLADELFRARKRLRELESRLNKKNAK
ncbi:MAG: cell division protein ZapA [Firmicutes bacterium]|nr:cell division protein ZapA [Bacillota bacterium]